jgi:PAS domain S-box-containing protein
VSVDNEHLFRVLVDNLPELAWTALPDGHIDFYNRRWFEYTGTTLQQMEGWGWESVHDPLMLPRIVAQWKHSLETGELFEIEFPIRGADGTYQWFLTRAQPLRDGAGHIVRWFGLNTNIDELRETRRKTEALLEAVGQQAREMEHKLHELRTAKERAEAHVAELERSR